MNYEFKGTPGPWRWEINPKSKGIMLCGGKRLYDLTVVGFERWGMQGATPLFLDANQIMHPAIDFSVDHPERKHHSSWFKLVDHPDANLIAAAPCLLEALKAFVDYPEEDLNEWAKGDSNITVTYQPVHFKNALEALHKALNINQ